MKRLTRIPEAKKAGYTGYRGIKQGKKAAAPGKHLPPTAEAGKGKNDQLITFVSFPPMKVKITWPSANLPIGVR